MIQYGKMQVCILLNSRAPNILKKTLFYPTATDAAKDSPNYYHKSDQLVGINNDLRFNGKKGQYASD